MFLEHQYLAKNINCLSINLYKALSVHTFLQVQIYTKSARLSTFGNNLFKSLCGKEQKWLCEKRVESDLVLEDVGIVVGL